MPACLPLWWEWEEYHACDDDLPLLPVSILPFMVCTMCNCACDVCVEIITLHYLSCLHLHLPVERQNEWEVEGCTTWGPALCPSHAPFPGRREEENTCCCPNYATLPHACAPVPAHCCAVAQPYTCCARMEVGHLPMSLPLHILAWDMPACCACRSRLHCY